MATRKVYISACGIGLGHIGRVVAVADELKRAGAEVVFSTYGPAYRYITAAGYRAYESPMLMWEEEEDGSVSTARSVRRLGDYIGIFRKHLAQERERIREERPDAIISDSRYSTVFVETDFDAPFFFISNQIRFLMPDWRRGGFPRLSSDIISALNYHWLRHADGIFVPDFPLPDAISRENMQVPPGVLRRLTFTGPISRRSPEEMPDVDEIRRKYVQGEDLFVYAAVSGPGKSRLPMLEALQATLPSFRRKSVIVRGEPGNDTNIWQDEWVNVRGWAEDRYELLKACDVVVSRPGLTTISEIVRFGKPCVLIPTPGQSEQEGNARSMEALGAARLITQKEVSHRTVKEALEDIVARSPDYCRATARLQKLASDCGGARQIARTVLERAG